MIRQSKPLFLILLASADVGNLSFVALPRDLQGGQYVVLEILGKGAYGAVYRARR